MVYLDTSEEWQRQSSLLLQARPTTTRITTKYKIPNLDEPKYQNARKRKRQDESTEKTDPAAPLVPRAFLVLKTYDHESGACLKFKTDRAADVGRLINSLGRMGRHMAAMPEKPEGEDRGQEPYGTTAHSRKTAPEPAVEDVPPAQTSSEAPAKDSTSAPAPTGGDAGGNKKNKKKKGKK